ncbi:phage portal protein [Planomonospora algeriensis]
MQKFHDYYDSDERSLAFAQRKFREEFGYLFADWRDNFCGVVIDVVTERMRVDGFRWGEEPQADSKAAEIWQRNYLDAESNSAHADALISGESYLTVWADRDGRATITPESPLEMVVHRTPGSRRSLDAALKKYRDEWGTEFATLWTPETVMTSRRHPGERQWAEPEFHGNPLGLVPVVPLTNRPRISRKKPYSELKPIIPLQDAITKIVADALVASEFGAYPQRLITGIQLPEDEEGNSVAPIQAAVDRLMLFEDQDVKWGQFSAADLENYSHLVDMLVHHLASVSRVPPFYFSNAGGSQRTGEGTQSLEAGLIGKVKERQLHFGEAWEQAMRYAFMVEGDSRASVVAAETIWADPEYRSEGQRIDALLKLHSGLQVPLRQTWEMAGFTPQQIERFGEMRQEEKAWDAPTATVEVLKPQQGNSGNDAVKNAA